MTKVFLSPSSQTANLVHGGGNEQQYARARCERAAEVLRAHGVTVKVSSIMNDSAGGYFRSVAEGNAWGPDLYVADHTNATGLANSKARGVHNYCWLPDPASVNLGRAIGARMDRIIGGTHQIRDGSHLYEVNGPHATAVLLENGFHDNAQDAALIRSKPREMGEAIAYGILDHLGKKINQEEDMAISDKDAQKIAAAVWAAQVGRGSNRVSMATLLSRAANVWGAWFGRGANRKSAAQLLADTSAAADRIEAIVSYDDDGEGQQA